MAPHVLLVDDSTTVRMVIAAELREAGFRVTPVPTLDAARRAFAQYRERDPFHLAILDLLLPDGDGIDLLREIRRDPALERLPVMLLSSDARFGSRLRGLGVGADDFVGKPHSKSFLISRAHVLTGNTQTESAPRAWRVLVVDADPGLRDALEKVLRIGHGCDVVALESVDQAAQFLDLEGANVDGAVVDRRCFLRVLGLLRSKQPNGVPMIVLDDSPSATWPPVAAAKRNSAVASALVMPRTIEPGTVAEVMMRRLVEDAPSSVSSSSKIPIATIDAVRRLARGA
ncbi:response regulator [Polyangium sp. 15x6]|uniref:response regulator n=1 Tax=Polyangium sp. 15x6 TaxID=3042687 RepID=UPI00249BFDF9|nr:response regulator [Polyangium sp. 15x6]MDI3282633.1 response regulator [Polyangium sp. 15x6]